MLSQVTAEEAAVVSGIHFNTNSVGGINAIIEKGVLRKRTPLEFAKDLELLVHTQTKEFELSVISKSEYQLISPYEYLKIFFREHTSQTTDHEVAAMMEIHSEPYVSNKTASQVVDSLDSGDATVSSFS